MTSDPRGYVHRPGGARPRIPATRRIVETVSTIGIRGMLVQAISEEAKAFYLQLGLDPSPLEPMVLMVTVANLRGAIG